jgi:hypothetical protein
MSDTSNLDNQPNNLAVKKLYLVSENVQPSQGLTAPGRSSVTDGGGGRQEVPDSTIPYTVDGTSTIDPEYLSPNQRQSKDQ